MGELRLIAIELPAEAAAEPDPVPLDVPVPVAVAPPVVATVPEDLVAVETLVVWAPEDDVVVPEPMPTFTLPPLLVHWPWRPANWVASVTAAGVEPQFSYCCM